MIELSKSNKVKFNFANSQNIINGQNERSKLNKNGGIPFNKYAAISKPIKQSIVSNKIKVRNGPPKQMMPEQPNKLPKKISKKRKAW